MVVVVPGTAGEAGNERRAVRDDELHGGDLERVANAEAERTTEGRAALDDVERLVERDGRPVEISRDLQLRKAGTREQAAPRVGQALGLHLHFAAVLRLDLDAPQAATRR